MLEYLPYIWIAIIILSVGAEAATASIVSMWFIPPAIICLFLSFVDVPVWIQVAVFFVVSAIIFILSKFIFKRFMKNKVVPTNTDALIGKAGMVIVDVDNLRQMGVVRLEGKEWSARSSDDSRVLLKGEIVMVERIEGVKLICK